MWNRISSKLILAVAAVLVTAIGVFSYLLTSSQHQALLSQVELGAHQISETIKSGTQHDMLLNQRDRLHQTLDTFGRQQGIEDVRIFNKEGEIIYSSDPAMIGSMVDKRAEACYACHAADRPLEHLSITQRTRVFKGRDDVRKLGIINPIYNNESCWQAACHVHNESQTVLGVLDVTSSLEEVERQLAAGWTKVVLFALTTIIGSSLIIWLVFERLVGKPVGKLAHATRTVAGGDLGHRVSIKRDDELGYLATCFNDMTLKLAETQQQLYQSDKLASLGRMAAGVAHEINNPLTGVLTYGSFLLKRAEDPETRADLETIVRETKRCRQIVKGLLDFSRQARPKKQQVDVSAVIDRSLRILANRLTLDNISITRRIDDDLPTVTADSNQMDQVLINLLVNAADAIGDQGGTITISATELNAAGDKSMEITVADTGCGIPPDQVSKIFEPFYTTKDQEGTGLGLAVVWGIIDKHGGTVAIQSDQGRGTSVTIRLPVHAQPLIAEEGTA